LRSAATAGQRDSATARQRILLRIEARKRDDFGSHHHRATWA
jgi:hypothetical protein